MNEELESIIKHIQQVTLMAYSLGLKDGRDRKTEDPLENFLEKDEPKKENNENHT